MRALRRVVFLLGVAGLVAVVLFLPRHGPHGIVHPYLLGDSLGFKDVSWALAGMYAGAVVVVTLLLTLLLRKRG